MLFNHKSYILCAKNLPTYSNMPNPQRSIPWHSPVIERILLEWNQRQCSIKLYMQPQCNFILGNTNGLLQSYRIYIRDAWKWQWQQTRVHGANMGPIWGRQDPVGPHVDPINLPIWDTFKYSLLYQQNTYNTKCWPISSGYLNQES